MILRLCQRVLALLFVSLLIVSLHSAYIVEAHSLPETQTRTIQDDDSYDGRDVMNWVEKIAVVTAIWAAGLAILFGLGIVLSRRMMTAVQAQAGHDAYNVTPGERNMRRLYRFVILLTTFYFYLSIPIVVLMVVGLAGGIFYLFAQIGRIPRKAFRVPDHVCDLYAVCNWA